MPRPLFAAEASNFLGTIHSSRKLKLWFTHEVIVLLPGKRHSPRSRLRLAVPF